MICREHGSADVVLTDPGVSRRHTAIRAAGGRITVEDLGSSNGTYVNGAQVTGEVELADGDEVQVGGTVFSVHGADAATAVVGAGAPPTTDHPGPVAPGPARPQPPAARAQPKAAPSRLAPRPNEEGDNIPALAAILLGPLAILLVLFSGGSAFFLALPCGIGAIVLGNMGMRRVDRGQTTKHRSLANLGRITGIIGTILSVIGIIAVVLVGALLDAGEDSLSGLIDRIREEIEGVDVPDPEVGPEDVEAP